MFTVKGNMKEYGPVMIPSQTCWLTAEQQATIRYEDGLLAMVDDGKERGIWEGQRAPDNACMLGP